LGDSPRKGASCISRPDLSWGVGGSNSFSVSEQGEEGSFGEALDEFGSEENTELPVLGETLSKVEREISSLVAREDVGPHGLGSLSNEKRKG